MFLRTATESTHMSSRSTRPSITQRGGMPHASRALTFLAPIQLLLSGLEHAIAFGAVHLCFVAFNVQCVLKTDRKDRLALARHVGACSKLAHPVFAQLKNQERARGRGSVGISKMRGQAAGQLALGSKQDTHTQTICLQQGPAFWRSETATCYCREPVRLSDGRNININPPQASLDLVPTIRSIPRLVMMYRAWMSPYKSITHESRSWSESRCVLSDTSKITLRQARKLGMIDRKP